MAYDEFFAFINEMCNLINFGMKSNFSLVSVSLVDTGMPW